jgi:hypothetical protein
LIVLETVEGVRIQGGFVKKKYPKYLKNQKLRRENPNVRRIVNGEPVSFWPEKKRLEND